MFWDGYRWIDQRAAGDQRPAVVRPARSRPGILRFVLVLIVALVAAPQLGIATPTSPALVAASTTLITRTVQENGSGVRLVGRWRRASSSSYSGGHAAITWTKGARIQYTFTGRSITIIGPKGRWGGRALVTVDGHRRLVVTERSQRFVARTTIFRTSWATDGRHTVIVQSLGSPTGSSFTVDAFRVTAGRHKQGTVTAPMPTPTPVAISAPTLAPDPTAPATAAPTASPTQAPDPTAAPTPTSTPTAIPTIVPTPAPTPAPTQPPVGGIAVPDTIDATGTTDASAALNIWLKSVPDNSTIVFKAGGTYTLSQGIQFAGRHGLTFEGNGATLRATGSGSSQLSSLFVIGHAYGGAWSEGNTSITIRDFTLVGNDPTPGTYGGGEAQAGMEIEGVSGLAVSNVTVRAVYGDGFKVGDNSSDVTISSSHVESAGRNGVSVISGRRITVSRSSFDTIGYVTFDVEPNTSAEASDTLLFSGNTAGTWGAEFFSVDGSHTGAAISNVTVTGNRVTGRSLLSYVDNGNTGRDRNITFTDNTSSVPAGGPVLTFKYIDGVTVTGNVQPLASGSLAAFTNCTSITYP